MKAGLPSLKGRVKIFSIIAAMVLIFSNNHFTIAAQHYNNKIKIELNKNVYSVVNNYVNQLTQEQKYTNITYTIDSRVKIARTEPISILDNFVFYADYIELKIKDKDVTFYFKNEEDYQDFLKIVHINKSEKQIVRKNIGAETPKKEIYSYIDKTIVSLGKEIANFATQFKGNPYVYGGTSLTRGVDCSGFVQSIYKYFGINLPRTATAQSYVGKKVNLSNLQCGDLVFYGNSSISHVGLYIGGNQIIHASTPKGGIKIASVDVLHKITARRII